MRRQNRAIRPVAPSPFGRTLCEHKLCYYPYTYLIQEAVNCRF